MAERQQRRDEAVKGYAMLYALLKAEDYSLLGGSLLVFGLLAAVMIGTWRVDWYKLADRRASVT